jgi:site-specific DNA-methyltransferase (adenine-specific)
VTAGGALWVTGPRHIIFSIRFALQTLEYRIINKVRQLKPLLL